MSTGDDESRVCLGVATRRPSIAATPFRPASLLRMHATTQPAQATPLSEAQSATAGAPLPPPGLEIETLGSSTLAMKQTLFGMVVMKTYQIRNLMFLEKLSVKHVMNPSFS